MCNKRQVVTLGLGDYKLHSNDYKSVSYTHLDVYKRQGLGDYKLHSNEYKYLSAPVSYTHLDVYKRQIMHNVLFL